MQHFRKTAVGGKKMKLLLVIPAYNEEECIEEVVENIKEHYPQYDYVIVNDGSKDRTSAICHEKGYNVIDLPVNLGLAGAFQTGMKYAYYNDYDYAIQFDADGQHKPEYIGKMVEKIQEGYGIVIGSRFVTEKKPFSPRMLGSRLISFSIRLMTGKKINDPTSGMRLFSNNILKEFAFNMNYGPEPDTVSYLLKRGAQITEVQVSMDERIGGVSYLNFTRSILYMMRMLISILIIQNFRVDKSEKKIEKRIDKKVCEVNSGDSFI